MKITIECNTNELKELINKNIKVDSIKIKEDGYVDLGLPSGTLWNDVNEGGNYALYTYDEAVSEFDNNLPTKEQFKELKDKCTWEWTTQNWVNGLKVTGPNGNSIFLPAAGYSLHDASVYGKSMHGTYWSATPRGSNDAWHLVFNSSEVNMNYLGRYNGQSVRLVK